MLLRGSISAVGLVVLAGCGGSSSLGGSVAQACPLEFNDLLLRKQANFAIVQYQLKSGVAEQIVLKLAVDMDAPPKNNHYTGGDFLQRVSLSRAMVQGSYFPQVLHGELTFDQLKFQHGGAVRGHFAVLFADDTTLNGDFGGKLVEVLIE